MAWSLACSAPLVKISLKSVQDWWSNPANKQTNTSRKHNLSSEGNKRSTQSYLFFKRLLELSSSIIYGEQIMVLMKPRRSAQDLAKSIYVPANFLIFIYNHGGQSWYWSLKEKLSVTQSFNCLFFSLRSCYYHRKETINLYPFSDIIGKKDLCLWWFKVSLCNESQIKRNPICIQQHVTQWK